jgi:hypothetical protein
MCPRFRMVQIMRNMDILIDKDDYYDVDEGDTPFVHPDDFNPNPQNNYCDFYFFAQEVYRG